MEDASKENCTDLRAVSPRACKSRPLALFRERSNADVAYQTTLGWSLLTSGIVSLLLYMLPGDSVWWGVGLLIAGLAVLYIRRDDVSEALEAM